KDSRLTIDSTDEGVGPSPGPTTVVKLTTTFTGVNGQPIQGSILTSDFSLHDFTISVRFLLTQEISYVGYECEVTSDLSEQFYDTVDVTRDAVTSAVDAGLEQARIFLNAQALAVGQALTPWLLDAAFDVDDVSYSPTNSQPVPTTSPGGRFVPQGDIVVRYVGQPAAGGSGEFTEAPRRRTGSPSSPRTLPTAPSDSRMRRPSPRPPVRARRCGRLPGRCRPASRSPPAS